SRFFGMAVSGRQLTELARDSIRTLHAAGGGMPALEEASGALERSIDGFRRVLGGEQRQSAWRAGNGVLGKAMDRVGLAVDALRDRLEDAAVRDKALDNCWRRAQVLAARVQLFAHGATDEGEQGEDQVKWMEGSGRSFTLHVTPMD